MKGKLTKSTNSSFISVVPKVENLPSLADFRPISLIVRIYKILSNVFKFRLKNCITKVTGEVQSTFVGGRIIQDVKLIANEVIYG